MKNNVILVIVSVAIQLPGALLLALLINQELKGTTLFPHGILYAHASLHRGNRHYVDFVL